MRYIVLITLLALSFASSAEEIDAKYKSILFQYAKVALLEFDYLNSFNTATDAIEAKATYIKATDAINRTFYIVLFPNKKGSTYASFLLNKDGILELYGRGGIPPTPHDFKNNIKENLWLVVSYPDDI